MDGPTIGIDLGTTYSCVAVCQNGQTKMIPLENGTNIMASCVSFSETEGRKVGDQAKIDSILNPSNTVLGVKRYIGCRFEDKELQCDFENYLYEIFEDDGNPKIKITLNDQVKIFTPEEISSMVLQKLKESAEAYIKKPISKAVITVPANFKDSQRQATKDAGRIAGLEVLRIINEPTAAALAFGIVDKYKMETEERNIVVFDFGGGTFDVSIINLQNGILDVKASIGNNHLGGDDIDMILVNHFSEDFMQKNSEDLKTNRRALRRLRLQCEKIKRELSDLTQNTVSIDLPLLHNSKDYYSSLTRETFDELCEGLIKETLNLVQRALEEAHVTKDQIDDILLVGGSTRIPKVQNMVESFFNKPVNKTLNPDEAVAMGAAVQAAILDGVENQTTGALLLLDVTSLSLGVETEGGVVSVLIPRNSPIPAKVTKRYSNSLDNQKKVRIVVFEGERSMTEGNNKLGEFILCGLQPKPRGQALIDVTFEQDTNGILYVTAEEITDNINNKLTVEIQKGRLSDLEINNMIKAAAIYKIEDDKKKEIITAKIALENYCYDLLSKANNIVNDKSDSETLRKKCQETLDWIKNSTVAMKEEYETKKKEMYNTLNPLIKRYL